METTGLCFLLYLKQTETTRGPSPMLCCNHVMLYQCISCYCDVKIDVRFFSSGTLMFQ